jgi:signal transduction histidine kinase
MAPPAAALRVFERPASLPHLPQSALDAALVGGRVVLAVVCVIDIWWRGSAGTARTILTDGLVLYALVSGLVAAAIWRSDGRASMLALIIGLLDVCAIGLLTLVDDPFGAHLFLVLAYAFTATSSGARARDAVATTGIVGASVAARLGRQLLFAGTVRLAGPVVVCVAAAGILFTWVNWTRRTAIARASAAARLIGRIRPEPGPQEVFRAVLDELVSLSTARSAIVALEHRATGRMTLVRFPSRAGTRHVRFEPVARAKRAIYFFDAAIAPSSVHTEHHGAADVRVLACGHRTSPLPTRFLAVHPCARADAFAFTVANEWEGRLFLLDPDDLDIRRTRLRWVHGLLQELVPAVAGICDLDALRTRAASRERARLGRELHDGIVQELARLDIELELLRRAERNPDVVEGIARVQQGLQAELRQLRALLQTARSHDVHPSRLTTVLADAVERFRAETGIAARFVCDASDVELPPQTCGEITRIVHEALVNVRRHSGAKNVLIRFGCEDGEWRLSIQDDGCGFQTWVPLGRGAAAMRPPAVIEERAQAIGARLTLGSGPGCGARLDIALGHHS